ncbi:hypothetical protein SFR_3402 [Streptomyces sp. FR-008]|nr:hypothetical protein SFR_3402 [Streptomyces sp. FR-008]
MRWASTRKGAERPAGPVGAVLGAVDVVAGH